MSTKLEAAATRLREAIEDFETSHQGLVDTVRDLSRQGIDPDLLTDGSLLEPVNDIINYAADTA